MKKNYLFTELNKHLFVPVFMETIDLYLKYRVISPNDFVVYQTMMRFLCRDKSNRHYGFTYITNSGIASITGVSAPTVAKSIKNLNTAGLIAIHDNPHRQGKNQKYRYTIFEPLNKEYFFNYFNIKEEKREEIDETNYNQPNINATDLPEGEIPLTETPEKEDDQLIGKPKTKAKPKAKTANKKTFKDKDTDDWNYNDFIAYFCHKFTEAYGTEYRVGSTNFAKENARFKQCCTSYFNADKLAFKFYMDEIFKKRAQFESLKFPTLSIGTVCTFTNNFKLEKFAKMAMLHRNGTSDNKNIQQEDEKFDNPTKNMLKSNKEDENKIELPLNPEEKKAFTELKSLFS